jgi:cell fate (sporulation/competence/biofilm development) regulator YlbF (YheA/YmcA/DUF963 family)
MPHPAVHPAVDNRMSEMTNFSPELYQATESLIQNLLAAEPFQAYQQSQTAMNTNSQAHTLLERLSTLQTGLRRKQSSGGVTQTDIDELRAVQTQIQAHDVIMEYARSQQDAVAFLREINQEISQLLGVDFAALAKKSSC